MSLVYGLCCLLSVTFLGEAIPHSPSSIPPSPQKTSKRDWSQIEKDLVYSHGISVFGPEKLKYKPNEPYIFANVDAPKGGMLRLIMPYSFTKLNPFTIDGVPPMGWYLVFETLAATSYDVDDPLSCYGLIAESFALAPDKSAFYVKLNPNAKFSDGEKITAEDVLFSYNILFSTSFIPAYRHLLDGISGVTQIDEHTVRFEITTWNRELALNIVNCIYILPKHVYGKAGKNFAKDFDEWDKKTGEMCPLVGSGPYLLDSFDKSVHVTWLRNPHYWGKDLPVNRGRYNFEKIVFKVFQDISNMRQAVQADDVDFGTISSAKEWAIDFSERSEPIQKGWLIRDTEHDDSIPSSQSFMFNIRRPCLKDLSVRLAVSSLMDFDHLNKNMFYEQYVRQEGYFDNHKTLKSFGPPEGRLFDYLIKLRQEYNKIDEIFVPDQVFLSAPQSWDGDWLGRKISIDERIILVNQFLDHSGWLYDSDRQCRVKNGIELKIEFLLASSGHVRIVNSYLERLREVGIRAEYKMVQIPEYIERMQKYDFDITTGSYGVGSLPGVEQYSYWHSKTANDPGGRNYVGAQNPALDDAIDQLVNAETYEDIIFYAHAVDRLICANAYLVFQWYCPIHRFVYWNRFGRPQQFAGQLTGMMNVYNWWWYDEEADNQLKKFKSQNLKIENNESLNEQPLKESL